MTKIFSIQVITTLVFTYAAIYNVIYFFFINIKLITFLHFTDYLSNAMTWLPSIFVMIIFVIYLEFSEASKKTSTNESALEKNSSNIFFKYIFNPVFLLIISFIAIEFCFPSSPNRDRVLFTIVFITYIFWFPDNRCMKYIKEKYGRENYLLLNGFGLILIIVAKFAIEDVRRDTSQVYSKFTLSSEENEPIILIRYLSKGKLIRRISTNKIEMINNNGDVEISYQLQKIVVEPKICQLYGYNCSTDLYNFESSLEEKNTKKK